MILFALGNGKKKKFILLKALGHINEKKKRITALAAHVANSQVNKREILAVTKE